ncbi:MAG: trypsin-like peptidase domain-containing protein [Planctomycetota bacterium]
MSRIRWYGPTILLLLTVTGAMVLGPTLVRKIARSYEDQRIELVGQRLQENPSLAALSDSFKDIATFVKPSITSISILARDPATGKLVDVGNGSGWVYRHFPDPAESRVYQDVILTNHHVVEQYLLGRADQVIVRFDDGGEYRAYDLRTDPKTDVAVLYIDRDDLRPARIASEPAIQGELAFAFGSPFHFEFSMSQGIVSATGRQLRTPGLFDTPIEYENYIQTDAAINPGNSGGPLTNVRGEVIGMNTAIATNHDPAASFSGLGFAIPVDLVVRIADRLLDDGEVRRGFMGVNVYNIDFNTSRELGFDGRGVLCNPVPGSPAAEAGIRLGDIITHVSGKPVRSVEEVQIETSTNPPGDTIDVRVWRMGEELEMRITLTGSIAGRPARPPVWDSLGSTRAERRLDALGIERLETLLPDVIDERGWAYTPGVLVRRVERNSIAQKAGIQPGMILTYFNGTPIVTLADLVGVAEGLQSGDRLYAAMKKWDSSTGQYEQFEAEFVMP